ncbi:UDP-N-acetylglucosamine 2-epimerase (non-hydrolyzing) [Thermoleophilia bacterium SCSIO 60948]|nr:UDP-N-acetylglucosamine 2-epimerase (non-hydrolyzing) [Thermoleophilia bacterium SCSIO 60948]
MSIDDLTEPAPSGRERRTGKLKVPVIVGTRPEAIKLVPIIIALRDSEMYEPMVVSTGQHHRMVSEIFDLAGIETQATLHAGSRHAGLNDRVATVMGRFADFIDEQFNGDPGEGHFELAMKGRYPIAVAVHGDTSSAMAAAMAAFHMRIPVIHVEAGLRTGGLNLTPFPEEMNRQVIGCLAAMHLAPTSTNLQNLIRENVPVEQIFTTGNTGVDALHWASRLDVPFSDPAIQSIVDDGAPIVVVTAHRRENWGAGIAGISKGIARLADRYPDVRFIVPMHPNPAVRETIRAELGDRVTVLLTEPLQYAEFARLLGACHLVITDSGGIQEEAPSLGKPVLVARESTERVEGIAAGTLILVGSDPSRIEAEASRLLSDEEAYERVARAINPYGDGMAAERIVKALEYLVNGDRTPQQFGSGFTRRGIIAATGYEVPMTPSEAAEEPDADHAHEHEPSGVELWTA